MRKFIFGLIAVACFGMLGCSPPSNMIIGDNTLPFDVGGQRVALAHVKIIENLPPGGNVLGTIEASRCHRFANSPAPTEDNIKNDLKILAYTKGADVIYGIEITKESGLTIDCWHVLKGTATMISLQENDK